MTRQYLTWGINLAIALAVLRMVKKIPLSSLFDSIKSWYLLVFLIWFIPIVIPVPPIVWFLQLIFGVTYVIHFSKLTQLLRHSGGKRNKQT